MLMKTKNVRTISGTSALTLNSNRESLKLLLAFLALVVPAAAASQDDHRFSLSLGAFVTDRASETRVDASDGTPGTPVDIEGDLGLDASETVIRLDGYFKFNDRHRIDFSVFDLSRDATRQIDAEITWDDFVFPINTTINSDLNFNIYKLAYTWSFLRREKGYLGFTAGLYVADVAAKLSAENIADGAGGGVTAPLPVIGLRGEYYLSNKWTLRGSAEFFGLEFEAMEGSLTDLYAGIDYKLFEHAAIGLALNSVKMDVNVSGSTLKGALDWQYDGVLLFFKFDF
jgi:hypothetical protein